jgi:polyhydroxyalkanoate synthesis regulator phasin
MASQLERTFYAGLGMALRTKDAIADMAQRLAQEQQLNEVEGRRLSDNMVRQAEEFRDRLSGVVKEQVDETLKQLDLVRKSDVQALERRIQELEAKIAAMQAKE